ncbi:MAG: hypothetical protein IT247_05755, partial [Bacteroidia bacterium]|nr:hypothetical protein [Bacteroidia bacterium]
MKHILRILSIFLIAFCYAFSLHAQNLALSATASHSGGGAGTYGPQNYNDQVISTGTFGWVSTSGNPSTTSWIQYDWASAVTCSKIKVYCDNVTTRTLTGAAIQKWDAGTSTWVTLLTYSIAPTLVYEITFPTATTTKLRLTNLVTSGSQSSNPSINEIQVSLGAAYDLSPSAMVSPVNFCGDAAAPLTVRVTNNGSASMTGFNITAQMTGPLSGTYTRTAFSRTIASGASDTVIFTTGLNTLTNLGQYDFLIYLSHAQDTFRANDTLRSTLQVIGTPSAPAFTHSNAVCGSGPLKLHVSAVPNTGTFWYTTPTSPVASMLDTFITPPLYTSSATYYASRVRYDVNNVMGFTQGNTIYGGNGYNFMFDVKAGNTSLVLDSISFYNATGVTSSSYKIFYKVGTNIGFQTNSGAWTLGMSQTGYSMNGTGEVKLPCGNIIIPAGQTVGIYLFLESTYGYSKTVSQLASADVTIVSAASIVYGGLFGSLSTTSYQWTGKLYYRKLCMSGMLSTTVTMNPKPYGGDVVPDTKFQGMNNGGASYAPDIVGSRDTVSYKLNPPTGFSNSNFGSAWTISGMSFTTSGGIAPGAGDTMTTVPNGSNPGTLQFVPSV